ncbi:MAG: hypothetical protein CML73_02135 [Rhodobiaceae bacterium]|nr:hypothetical protein [Rhodobiaceae bacterium]
MKPLILIISLLFSTPALAENTNQYCPISYDVFEDEISHIDLAKCPDNKPGVDVGFCRLVFDGDTAFIYVFIYTNDDACLSEIIQAEKNQYLISN